MRVAPYSDINRYQWTSAKYKDFVKDSGDLNQAEETAPERENADFYRIWQSLQMQSAARRQQVEGKMTLGRSSDWEPGKASSVIQKAQENGFDFRYVGNEDEIDEAFFQYRWNDGKKMTWDEQLDLELVNRSRLLDFVTDLKAYTSMVASSKIRFDNPGPYSSMDSDNSITFREGQVYNFGEFNGFMVTFGFNEDYYFSNINYTDKLNELTRRMLGTVPGEMQDLSKLTPEQLEEFKELEKEWMDIVLKIGGPEKSEEIHRILDSLQWMLKIITNNYSLVGLGGETGQNAREGLEMLGIDTSKPFVINGYKMGYNEHGFYRIEE